MQLKTISTKWRILVEENPDSIVITADGLPKTDALVAEYSYVKTIAERTRNF